MAKNYFKEDEIVVGEYKKGKTIIEISNQYGIPKTRVYNRLVKNNVKLRNTGRALKLGESRKTRMIELIKDGKNRKEIIEELGITNTQYYYTIYITPELQKLVNTKVNYTNKKIPLREHTLDDIEITKDGKLFSRLTNQPITTHIYHGFERVRIGRQEYYVHRLVLDRYHPMPFPKASAHHIDGNTTNNKLENLEWLTHQQVSSRTAIRRHEKRRLQHFEELKKSYK